MPAGTGSLNVHLDIFGDVQLDRNLLRVGEHVGNMLPVLEALADDFLLEEKRQFDTQGGYASGGWAPLADSTVAYKAAMGLDPRILHATLAMRNSLTVHGAPGQLRVITPEGMELGTSVKSDKGYPYPAVHQKGSRDGRIPQRRPVELTEASRIRWVKMIQRWVVHGALEGVGA